MLGAVQGELMRKILAGESQPSNGLAFPQIAHSAGFFASAGAKADAGCGYENNKCQDSLRKKGDFVQVAASAREENKMSEEKYKNKDIAYGFPRMQFEKSDAVVVMES